MLYVSVEAIARRRPEIVWDVLTDIPASTSWVEGLIEASTDDERPPKAGSLITLKRRAAGKKQAVVKARAEITVFKPHSLLVIETRAPDLLLLDRMALEPVAEGTLLKVSSEMLFGNKLVNLLTRRSGLFLGSSEPHPVDGIYERSVQALVKRIETISAAPFR